MRTLVEPPILPSEHVQIQRVGSLDQHNLRVYVFADVLDEIMFHAQYRKEPSMTLLSGGSYEGPAGPYIEIQGFCESTYVDDTRSILGLLRVRYPRIIQEMEEDTSNQVILGWSHGQSGSHGRVDTDTLLVHLTWFNLQDQVFLSIDPDSEECGFYRSGPKGKMRNIGFTLIRALGEPEVPVPKEPAVVDDTKSAVHGGEALTTSLGAPDGEEPVEESPQWRSEHWETDVPQPDEASMMVAEKTSDQMGTDDAVEQCAQSEPAASDPIAPTKTKPSLDELKSRLATLRSERAVQGNEQTTDSGEDSNVEDS